MEKRLVLAIALSVLVIVAFQYFAKPPIKTEIPRSEKTTRETPATIIIKEPELKSYVPTKILSEEKEFNVETDRYSLSFSNVGGSIKKIRLKDYKNLRSDEPLDLVEINTQKNIYSLSATHPMRYHYLPHCMNSKGKIT